MQEAYLGIGKRYVSAWVGFFFMALFSIGPVSILVLVIERFVWWIQGTWISYLMIFFSLAFIVYLGIRWRLMLPAILLETRKATEGLDRSWKLTHGIFWRVFGITFLVGILVYLFSTLPQTAINYGLEFFSPGFSYASIALTIFSQSTLIFTSPFITAVNVVLFYDILVRKEGFDLTLQLGMTPPPFPSEELTEKKEPDDYSQNPW